MEFSTERVPASGEAQKHRAAAVSRRGFVPRCAWGADSAREVREAPQRRRICVGEVTRPDPSPVPPPPCHAAPQPLASGSSGKPLERKPPDTVLEN